MFVCFFFLLLALDLLIELCFLLCVFLLYFERLLATCASENMKEMQQGCDLLRSEVRASLSMHSVVVSNKWEWTKLYSIFPLIAYSRNKSRRPAIKLQRWKELNLTLNCLHVNLWCLSVLESRPNFRAVVCWLENMFQLFSLLLHYGTCWWSTFTMLVSILLFQSVLLFVHLLSGACTSLFCCHCNIYHRIEHRFEKIYLSAQWIMFSANCCQLCVWNGYKADFSSSPALPFKLVLREIYQKVIPASSLFSSFLFVCRSLITSTSASSCPLTCSFSLSSCSPISLSTPQVPAFYHYSLSFAHSYSPLLPSLLLYQHQTQGQHWRECCPGLDETNSIRRSCLFVFVALPYPYNSSVPSYFMSYLF